jgi:uncharacterized YigZ family protein
MPLSLPKLVPAREARAELQVLNSIFIASISPSFSVDEAKSYVGRIRRECADASHNVPAYLIGHGTAVTAHCHDDGEPAGTAGRPALAVLRGSGLGDVVVVVTRYFGGTKLGRGGLVRAYGDAVREVLAIVPRAQKVATQVAVIELPYSYYERIRRLISVHQGQILREEFAAEVSVTARFAVQHMAAVQAGLGELSNGSLEATIIETDETTLLPVDGLS